MKKHIIKTALTIFILSNSFAYAQYAGGNVYTAARLGNIEAIKKFVDSSPDQHTLNNALGAAIVGEQLKVMSILIDQGANVNHYSSFNTSLLINTIMKDKFKAAELLIKNGANIHVKGYQSIDGKIKITWFWTPLMCATYKGNYHLVKLLLKKGADPLEEGWSQSSYDIETSADIAAYSGHLKILKLLIKKGDRIDTRTVFKAAKGGHVNIIKFLLAKKFDINAREASKGRTIISEASFFGQYDLVKFLLKKGADPEIKDLDGYSAIGHANINGHKDVANLIKNFE